MMSHSVSNLTDLIDTLEQVAPQKAYVSVDDVFQTVGLRTFGPLLLAAGLITLMPVVGDIPGVPTLMAAILLLTGGQLLAGRRHVWLPHWLLKRQLSRASFIKALQYARKPACWVDRWLRVRWRWLTGKQGNRLTAVTALIIALAMPPMEFIPFSANGAGLALTLLGLGLVARDGCWILAGMALTLATCVFVSVSVF